MNTGTTVTYSASEQMLNLVMAGKPALEYNASSSFCSDFASIRISPSPTHPFDDKHKRTVLRRFRGFLIEIRGYDARVAFSVKNQLIEYHLPADRLQKGGISAENQPFEMDEIEFKTEEGSFVTGYEFRPSAKPTDSFRDSFGIDAERERKRTLIFQKFKHASD